jgi:CheY-like chemotaxis protein
MVLMSAGTIASSNQAARIQPEPQSLLVVDDDAESAAMLEKALGVLGYAAKLAASAADAIRLAESQKFDLVVSDIDLPDTGGCELMANLRDRFAMQGIALTGHSGSEATSECRKAGFAEHIIKPVDLAQLDNAIRRVLRLRTLPSPA